MASEYEVSVIIPTLRIGDDLLSCLESIAGDPDSPPHEVIVVFNAPIPPDLDLKSHHPNARPVEAGRNLGYATACNLGAREASGGILVFLNDDMIVRTGWMNELVKPISDSDTSASGGRILSRDGKKIDFNGGSFNLLGWGFQVGHGDPVDKLSDEFGAKTTMPFACGGNFAVDAEVFESVGGFDDDYFAYYEDVDFGWRLMLTGKKIAWTPGAVIHHNAGATGKLMPPQTKWFLQERNALQTIIKNYSDETLLKILPVAMALVSVRASILSGLEEPDIFPDEFWHEVILGDEKAWGSGNEDESGGFLRGLVDGVKESLKTGMKNARRGSLPDGWLPVEKRGAAGLLALEWCLRNWPRLMEKRADIQSMRIRNDNEILPLFDDPLRPVLGHPREFEAMKPLEKIMDDLISGIE